MVSMKRSSRGKTHEKDNNMNGEIANSARFLDEKENSKTKKKGLFSVFGKKKNGIEHLPGTPPMTPESLDVTVMDTEYDPAAPYKLTETKSDVSGLTDRDTISPLPRKVDFDMNKEQKEIPPPDKAGKRGGVNSIAQSVEETGNTLASSTVAETKVTTDTDHQCGGDSIVLQTLGMLDDFCNPPEAPGDQNPSGDARRTWGTVPSEDDDDTASFQHSSLQSTVDDSSLDRHFSSINTGNTTANNCSVEVDPPHKVAPSSPPQDHENFEVVLDTGLLKGPPTKRRSLFAFSKREDNEEEKKEEVDQYASSAEESRSSGRKSLVKRLFSARKVKEDSSEEEKPAPVQERKLAALEDKPTAEKAPIVESLEALTKVEALKREPSDEKSCNEERGADEASVEREFAPESPKRSVPTVTASRQELNEKEKEDKWKKMVTQLELAEQVEQDKADMADVPTESFEVKAKSPTRKSKEKTRSLSLGRLSKRLLKPMKSVVKRSKDDSDVKETKPVKLAAKPPPPPPAPAPPVKKKKPKPTWKAVVDPNSGKTYYYHRKTRETTWIKPEALKQYEAKHSTAAKKPEEETNVGSTEKKAESVSRTLDLDKKADDEVVVSDDRFKTPPRGGVTEVRAVDTTESTSAPPAVVKADIMAQQSLLDKTESEENAAATKNKKFDAAWEKKKEIERLLTQLSPPDKASVDNLMKQYEGKEGVLLRQLREKVESQPFDEPFLDEPAEVAGSASAPSSPNKLFTRTTTYVSKASATTKSSTKTDKTEKIKNTFSGKKAIETISETHSTATSLSSRHDDQYEDRAPVPRERELLIEELSNSRVVAETFDTNGRVTRGRATEFAEREDSSYYDGDNEVDTCTSDTVSALSENDGDFLSRKENFDQARRRALDDAIEREDWDLAAVLSEGMRSASSSGDNGPSGKMWTPGELDRLIASNDWEAVKGYISRMQSHKAASLKAIDEDPDSRSGGSQTNDSATNNSSIVKAPSRQVDLAQDTSLTKRVGSKSQLQHQELQSESSWTSDSSYESSGSEYS